MMWYKTTGIVYKCTNTENGMVYIGKTELELEHRIRKHLEYAEKHEPVDTDDVNATALFPFVLVNEGFDVFEWEVLCECDISFLCDKELQYIEKYRNEIGEDMMYNMRFSIQGVRTSPEYYNGADNEYDFYMYDSFNSSLPEYNNYIKYRFEDRIDKRSYLKEVTKGVLVHQ